MRSLLGLCLLLVGLSVGAYAYYPEELDRRVHLADVTRILSPAGRNAEHVASGLPLDGNSDTALFTHSEPVAALSVDRVSSLSASARGVRYAALTERENVPTAVAPKAVLVGTSSWSTVVKKYPRFEDRTGKAAAMRPTDGASRFNLIRDLQSRLRKAGCYYGEIDGDWGPGSRRAMSAFNRLVNAALPVDRPDYFQLALLETHATASCAAACPNNETRDLNGQCRPSAVVARYHNPRHAVASRSGSKTAPLTTGSVKRVASVDAGAPIVAPQPRLVLRSRADREAYREVARVHRPALPGRMTVGGPRPDQIDARHGAPGTDAVPALVEQSQAAEARARKARAAARRAAKSKRAKAAAKRKKRSYRRYSKASRQRALIRQAFGDGF